MVASVFPPESPASAFPLLGDDRQRLRLVPAAFDADRLVDAYHYLCHRGARKFLRAGLERSDLEQVAAIGLIKASRRYDPTTSTPFEAYAWLVIVGELMHHVRDSERIVRVPRRLHDLERHFIRASEALSGRLGRDPTERELADEIGVVTHTVRELRRARESALVMTLDDTELRRLRAVEPLALEDRLLFDAAFTALGEDERRIIVGIYILGLTQLELGRRLGISPKRVSRTHRAALQSMQRSWAS